MQRIKEEKRGQKRFQAEGVSASLVTNNITSVPTANKYLIGRTSSANGHHIGTLTRKQVEKHFGQKKNSSLFYPPGEHDNGKENDMVSVPNTINNGATSSCTIGAFNGKPPRPQTLVEKYRQRAQKDKADGTSFGTMMGYGGQKTQRSQ